MAIALPVHLQEVMHRAVEKPLDVYLAFSPEAKSAQSQGGANMGKDGSAVASLLL